MVDNYKRLGLDPQFHRYVNPDHVRDVNAPWVEGNLGVYQALKHVISTAVPGTEIVWRSDCHSGSGQYLYRATKSAHSADLWEVSRKPVDSSVFIDWSSDDKVRQNLSHYREMMIIRSKGSYNASALGTTSHLLFNRLVQDRKIVPSAIVVGAYSAEEHEGYYLESGELFTVPRTDCDDNNPLEGYDLFCLIR